MKKYDIYLADVPYREDNDKTKLRPVLILNDTVLLISVLPITSQGKTGSVQYKITDWKEAGLKKQSYIMLEPLKFKDRKMIHKKIGRLQSNDILRLEMKLYRTF